jgi:hypothetical protein
MRAHMSWCVCMCMRRELGYEDNYTERKRKHNITLQNTKKREFKGVALKGIKLR